VIYLFVLQIMQDMMMLDIFTQFASELSENTQHAYENTQIHV